MANKEKLPWDLTQEVLSRVPPNSLVRFRTVCKQWNTLVNDKTFINNHMTTFRFILTTKSKMYSVSINPRIEVRELTLDILESHTPRYLIDCDGILLCDMGKGALVCNPWLRHTRWIEPMANRPKFRFCGIGYDEISNCYKTLAFHGALLNPTKTFWKTHDFSSDAWTYQNGVIKGYNVRRGRPISLQKSSTGLSLSGTWYQVASYDKTKHLYLKKKKYMYFLVYFDCSIEQIYKFCDLPCKDNRLQDVVALGVFGGDRFALLKQSHLTKKIQVWVTKNKIHKDYGYDVEWIDFMDVSVPNLPNLVQTGTKPFSAYSQPSFFVEDKRLVVCSCDETGRAWIYVVGNNSLISKTKLDLIVDLWPLHCSFIPSLVSLRRGQIK